MFNIPLANQPEYRGDYLGGNASFQGGIPILLKFEKTTIDLFQYYSGKERRDQLVSNNPFTSVFYENIVGVNVVSQERISTLRVLLLGVIPGLLLRQNKNFLLLNFKDKVGLEQTFVFSFMDNYVVCSAIQNKVAESKKKVVD
jgi:hypothetical protein